MAQRAQGQGTDSSGNRGFSEGFAVNQLVKNAPTVQETWVQSLGWEDHRKKEMATHSSILAWIIPWTEETGGLQFMGSQSDMTEQQAMNTQ